MARILIGCSKFGGGSTNNTGWKYGIKRRLMADNACSDSRRSTEQGIRNRLRIDVECQKCVLRCQKGV